MKKVAWVKRSGRISRTHLLDEDGTTICGRVIPDLKRTTNGGPVCARCDRTAAPVIRTKNTAVASRKKTHKDKTPTKHTWHYEECALVLYKNHLCAGCKWSYNRGKEVLLCKICQSLGCDKIEFRSDGIVYLRKERDNVQPTI